MVSVSIKRYISNRKSFFLTSGLSSTQQILFRITVATLVTLAIASVVALPLYFVAFSPAQIQGMRIL
jgi:hypothetical protein